MIRQLFMGLCLMVFLLSCGKKTQEIRPVRKDIVETVFASGILEANNTYNLMAQSDGYLIHINFNEGDIVTKGNVLAIIDNKESGVNTASSSALLQMAQNNTSSNAPALAQAQKWIAIAKEQMKQDALQENRYQSLWNSNSVAKIDYEKAILNAITSKANYETAVENYKKLRQDAQQQLINSKTLKGINTIIETKNKIKAVVSGKVYKKEKQVGDYVRRGDVIATIGSATEIYAKITIDESNIAKIKIGQEAEIQLNTNKAKVYKAEVFQILPSFNESTQSFTCKLSFVTPLEFTIINTQLQSNIIIGTKKSALLIPRNFIDFGGFVQIKNHQNKTRINTSIVSNEWVQVLDGIDEKTILVTENIASNNIKTSEAGAQINKQ
jgi:HlyD family secretion protein